MTVIQWSCMVRYRHTEWVFQAIIRALRRCSIHVQCSISTVRVGTTVSWILIQQLSTFTAENISLTPSMSSNTKVYKVTSICRSICIHCSQASQTYLISMKVKMTWSDKSFFWCSTSRLDKMYNLPSMFYDSVEITVNIKVWYTCIHCAIDYLFSVRFFHVQNIFHSKIVSNTLHCVYKN